VTAPPSKSAIKRWLVFDRAVSLFHNLVSRATQGGVSETTSRPFQRVGLMMIIILLFAVVASSHQLTPFMTIIALAALVALQGCNARSLPTLMIVLAVTWIIYMAGGFLNSELESLIRHIGELTDNIGSNLIDVSQASPGQRIVATMGRGLTASLWCLAFLGVIRRLRQGFWDLSIVPLAAAPFTILLGNSYGGEMLFRVYLFALPFMAFFAAALLYPRPASGTSWRTVAMTILVSGTLLIGLYFAHYGKERQYCFTQNEVDAAQFLYNVAPAGSLLVEGSRNYPSQFQNYEFYTYVPIAREPQASQSKVIDRPVEVLSRWMSNREYPAAYLIITRSQKAEIDMVGEMPAGSLDRIEQALMQSQEFQVVYENEDARIFVLANRVNGAGPGLALDSNIGSPIRPAITFWLLLFCPGMAFVRLLHIKERLTELTLAVALSITMSTIVSETMVLAKIWSPKWGLVVLICMSLGGAALQIIQAYGRDWMWLNRITETVASVSHALNDIVSWRSQEREKTWHQFPQK